MRGLAEREGALRSRPISTRALDPPRRSERRSRRGLQGRVCPGGAGAGPRALFGLQGPGWARVPPRQGDGGRPRIAAEPPSCNPAVLITFRSVRCTSSARCARTAPKMHEQHPKCTSSKVASPRVGDKHERRATSRQCVTRARIARPACAPLASAVLALFQRVGP